MPHRSFVASRPIRPTIYPRQPYHSSALANAYPLPPPAMQVERSDWSMPSARYHSHAVPSLVRRIEHGTQQPYYESVSDSDSDSNVPEVKSDQYMEGVTTLRTSLRHANTAPARQPAGILGPQTVIISKPRIPRVGERD